MNQILPYISIGLSDEWCIVVVEDSELFDFVDDFLTEECDLECEFLKFEDRHGGQIGTMYFPLDLTLAAIEQSLLKLSPEEIERIYKLNN